MYFSIQEERQVCSFDEREVEGEGMQVAKQFLSESVVTFRTRDRHCLKKRNYHWNRKRWVLTYSLILDIRYFAFATFACVWTAFIIRFFTCADSEMEVANDDDGDGDEEEDEEEPKGLNPPSDIVTGWTMSSGMKTQKHEFAGN